jgi:hypothetical protein
VLDELEPGRVVVDLYREPRNAEVCDRRLPELGSDAAPAEVGANPDLDPSGVGLAAVPPPIGGSEGDQVVVLDPDPRAAPGAIGLAKPAVAKPLRCPDRRWSKLEEQVGGLLRVAWPERSDRPGDSATLGGRGAIAQLGERLDRTQEVVGSSPTSSIRSLSN